MTMSKLEVRRQSGEANTEYAALQGQGVVDLQYRTILRIREKLHTVVQQLCHVNTSACPYDVPELAASSEPQIDGTYRLQRCALSRHVHLDLAPVIIPFLAIVVLVRVDIAHAPFGRRGRGDRHVELAPPLAGLRVRLSARTGDER